MRQPDDAVFGLIPDKPTRRTWWAIAFVVLVVLLIGIIPSMLYDAMFTKSVRLERMGWRLKAKYEFGGGIITRYSNLTYHGNEFGQSLPNDAHLVTPIGEFDSRQQGWQAVWSDPQIWDDAYRLPDVKEGEPWVRQMHHKRDIKEFLAQGYYQAPAEVRPYSVPWTDQQLKGTPANWVYVYRLSWRDRENDDYASHVVTGYWVDPAHLDDLTWEDPFSKLNQAGGLPEAD